MKLTAAQWEALRDAASRGGYINYRETKGGTIIALERPGLFRNGCLTPAGRTVLQEDDRHE